MDNVPCVVCGAGGHGLHFGVIACRACSSFFRRSIAERKNYLCRLSSRCVTQKNTRNTCRACRFRACLRAGMTIDVKQQWIGTVPDLQTEERTGSMSDQAASSQNNSPGQMTPNPPRESKVSHLLVEGIQTFHSSEKSLFTVENPNHIFCTTQNFTQLNEKDYYSLLKSGLSLVNSMFRDYYPPFLELTAEQRFNVIKSCFYECTLLYQSYQTTQVFPELDKLYAQYGFYYPENPDNFFEDPQSNRDIKSLGLITPLIKRLRNLCSKMITLKIGEHDLAFLLGILFCETVSDMEFAPPSLESFRDELFTDYYHFLKS